MNIFDLANTLPNGFHDSFLLSYSVDLENRTASMLIDILVGLPEGLTEEDREGLRPSRLDLIGVEYFIVEPPDASYKYREPGAVRIDLNDADLAIIATYPHSESNFAARFFVDDWNAFIHFAASEASLIWLADLSSM